MIPDLLTIKQAASTLQVSSQTIKKWRDAGKIEMLQIPNQSWGRWRVRLSEVKRLRKENYD